MVRLEVLGSAELKRADGAAVRSVLAQPKRLVLLTYLALAQPRGFHRRESLLALFWPEKDEERARNALRQSLHFLRRSLGRGVVSSRGEDDVGVDPERLAVDVLEFESLLRSGDARRALERYRGPFLEGVLVRRASELDRWMDDERNRLGHLAWDAALRAADAAAEEGDVPSGIALARRAVRMRPENDASVRVLMTLLQRAGDRAGALRAYEDLERDLRELHDAAPEPETARLADVIRTGETGKGGAVVALPTGERGSDRALDADPREGTPSPDVPRRVPWTVPGGRGWGLAALAAIAVVALWPRGGAVPTEPVEVFESPFPAGEWPSTVQGAPFSTSADGTTFAYVGPADGEGTRQVWLRRWSERSARPVPGTEAATQPALSRDAKHLAFVQANHVKVLSIDGGPTLTLGRGAAPRWDGEGGLYVSTPRLDRVVRFPAGGGAPDTVSERRSDEIGSRVTDVLPNGWALLTVMLLPDRRNEVRALDPRTGEVKALLEGSSAKYASTGHLLYLTADATLRATRLDLGRMEVTGPDAVVYDDVLPGFVLSHSGRLFYATDPRPLEALRDEAVWFDRSGRVTPLGLRFNLAGVYSFGWSLSPDGSRVAFPSRVDGNDDVWLKVLPDGPATRLTVDREADGNPWWSPDGASLTYVTVRRGAHALRSVAVGGSENPRPLDVEERPYTRGTWSPDGRWLVVGTLAGGGADLPRSADIVAWRPGHERTPIPVVATEFNERMPALSPDGRWLAYSSNRTGRYEIYVRPFPEPDGPTEPVSVEGGIVPVWARSGREIFFLDADRAMVSAHVETDPGFRVIRRETLFTVPDDVHVNVAGIAHFYDVSPDGQRFLMGRSLPREDPLGTVRFFVVNHFPTILKARLPS